MNLAGQSQGAIGQVTQLEKEAIAEQPESEDYWNG